MAKKKGMNKGLKITLIILATIVALVILGAILLVIIYGLTPKISNYKETFPVADTFYVGLKSQNYTTIDSMISDEVLNQTSVDELNAMFSNLDSKLGTIQSYSLVKSMAKYYVNGSMYVSLQYEVNRTNYNSHDTLTFVKKDDKYLILGVNFDSNGLLENSTVGQIKIV